MRVSSSCKVTQTGHDRHAYICMVLHTQVLPDDLACTRTCTHVCVHGIHISVQIQAAIHVCNKRNERNIGRVPSLISLTVSVDVKHHVYYWACINQVTINH